MKVKLFRKPEDYSDVGATHGEMTFVGREEIKNENVRRES